MKCKDLIKIIKEHNLEELDIIVIDLDDAFEDGDIVVWKNHSYLSYPEHTDFFDHDEPAEVYDRIEICVNMESGQITHKSVGHYDSSTEEQYPY